MDTNGLMTFLSILLASYALLPEERQRNVILKMSHRGLVIYSWYFAVLLCCSAYVDVIKHFFKLVNHVPYGLNRQSIIFTAFLIPCVFIYFKLRKKRLSIKALKRWPATVEKLLAENKIKPLGYLFERYHQQLCELVIAKTTYDKKQNETNGLEIVIIDYSRQQASESAGVNQQGTQNFGAEPIENKADTFSDLPGNPIQALARLLKQKNLAWFLPTADEALCNKISDSVKKLLRSKNFVTHLVTVYPSVAAKFSVIEFDSRQEYNALLFTELMENRHSHLYQELKNNTSGIDWNRYLIDPSNILLHFYFADINNAIRAQAWKFVGDYALDYIKQQTGKDNFYNQAYTSSFDDKGCWQCPIFIAITFFKIMILERLYQHAKVDSNNQYVWHIINCIRDFSATILTKLDPAKSSNMNLGYPTPFHTLLYRCVETSATWVDALIEIHKTDTAFIISDTAKQIMKLFGVIVHEVIAFDQLMPKQKEDAFEMALCRIQQLDLKHLDHASSLIVDHIFVALTYDYNGDKEIQSDYIVDPKFVSKIRDVYELDMPKFREIASQTFTTKWKEKIRQPTNPQTST